jgi:7-cyano-7-deazaguanine synthase
MKGVVCHLSGGFDSLASTLLVAVTGAQFCTVFYDIGQPYVSQERQAARIASARLTQLFTEYKGHYEYSLPLMLANTVNADYVPVRNLVLGAHSCNMAVSLGYDHIAVGNKTLEVREGDSHSFSDCSVPFYSMLGDVATFASEKQKLTFLMPLIVDGVPMSKADVIDYISSHGFDVSKLWSCYNNEETPCGVCYHCEEIKKANRWTF